MAKAKAKRASAKENGSQEAPPAISKVDAMTEALKQRGEDAKNTDLEDYIRTKYGEATLPANISVAKSSALKRFRGDQPVREPAKKAKTPMASSSPSGIDLDDLQEIKDLAERYGKDQVAKALDLVS